jgi:hypothetical protein
VKVVCVSSQQKNCKKFLNSYYHEYFHVAAEWNFFATPHGRSSCYRTGGTVKQLTACSSLQATNRNHIFTPEYFINGPKKNYRNYIIPHNMK